MHPHQHQKIMLCTPAAAERAGVSASTLNKLRVYGGGPRFAKLGARVVYDPADLDAWVNARKRQSTSEVEAV